MATESFAILIDQVLKFIEGRGTEMGFMIVKIKTNGVTVDFVRYLFYRVWALKLNGKITQGRWAEFLHNLFSIFDGEEMESTRRHFKRKPAYFDDFLKNTIKYQ